MGVLKVGPRRLASAAGALALCSAPLAFAAPASAAVNVTCNGGYSSGGPMGTFTYSFTANLNWASQNATHSVEMVMSYTGTKGLFVKREHYANNEGVISFTDTDTAPEFVDGVTITDETFIDGVSKGAFYVHPSCKTYAQSPAASPQPDPYYPTVTAQPGHSQAAVPSQPKATRQAGKSPAQAATQAAQPTEPAAQVPASTPAAQQPAGQPSDSSSSAPKAEKAKKVKKARAEAATQAQTEAVASHTNYTPVIVVGAVTLAAIVGALGFAATRRS